ncbi:MAG: hypothetical protein D6733_07170 [Methanobacteriota archaeon]|nr:MAG: hypothetical protein D6733_07170 [Euryarchaeota archaeon]
MSVSTYAYVNARIGDIKSYFLSDDASRGLIESRNLEEILSILKNTRYGQDLADATVLSMELQLKRNLYREYLKLINSVKGRPRSFIQTMARKFEVDTLKSIIKMMFLKVTLREYLIPFGEMSEEMIERLLKKETIGEVIEELKGTDYYAPLKTVHDARTGKGDEEDEERDLPYVNALENHYYGAVKEEMSGLSKKDRAMVKHFVGFNIDLSNLLMALRLRGLDAPAEDYFIEGGEGLTMKHFTLITRLENLSRLPDVVPRRFVGLVKEGLQGYEESNSLLSFEIAAKRYLLRESRKVFIGQRFHIGTIIAYLNLKENEISNLIKIIKTKDEFFSAKDIEGLLVMA